MTQSALAKERRELKDQQNRTMMDAIPKDLSRPWEDPMPEPGERHLAAVRRFAATLAQRAPILQRSVCSWAADQLWPQCATPPIPHPTPPHPPTRTPPHPYTTPPTLSCPAPAQELRSFNLVAETEMPEWKKKALGKAPTYGIKDARPITEQRQSLPIFKLKEQLLQAVHDHKVRAARRGCRGRGRWGRAGPARRPGGAGRQGAGAPACACAAVSRARLGPHRLLQPAWSAVCAQL
jgi:hypothetical protein